MTAYKSKAVAQVLPCVTCGKKVDVLRAPRIRFSATSTWVFCSLDHAQSFDPDLLTKRPAHPGDMQTGHAPRTLGSEAIPAESLPATVLPDEESPTLASRDSDPHPFLAASEPPNQRPSPREEFQPAADETFGVVPAAFSPKQDPPASVSSLPLRAVPRTLPRFTARSALAWAPVILSLVGTLLSATLGEDFWSPLATTFLLGTSAYVGLKVVRFWDIQDAPFREQLRLRLSGGAERLSTQGGDWVDPDALRPGEEIRVTAGQYVPADGTITLTLGPSDLEPWEGATEILRAKEGDRVVAGARVNAGEVHVACSRTGKDRALFPLIAPFSQRIETSVASARAARIISDHGSFAFAAICSSLVWLQGGSYAAIACTFSAVWGATSHPVARALPEVCARRWLNWALGHGIVFPHAGLLDRAGTVSSAAFCVRGTVLHGEPEVCEVHPLRGSTESEILSLAAGAESVVHHPVASAILRAARTRHVEVDPCRSHNTVRGMGVRCVTSSGDLLVLGSRELLLAERISIAMAEETLRSLESRGLSTLMLAKNQHLIGVLALQDSLRAGAKAAIQVLLDEHIEPVLISGDARATTEAVAHALAVDHVRPEVAASGRAREVKSLGEAGSHLAVVGTSPRDEAALAVAPVPIVLGAASLTFRDASDGKERAIGLASRQVISASLTLLTARKIRTLGMRALILSFIPAALASAASASLLLPAYVGPLLAGLSAVWAARSSLAARGPFGGLSPEAPPQDR